MSYFKATDIRSLLIGLVQLDIRERSANEILAERGIPHSIIEIQGLDVPYFDPEMANILGPLNVSKVYVLKASDSNSIHPPVASFEPLENYGSSLYYAQSSDLMRSEYYKIMLQEEKSWTADQIISTDILKNKLTNNNPDLKANLLSPIPNSSITLAEHLANVEFDLLAGLGPNGRLTQFICIFFFSILFFFINVLF
jgi:hypothetical protein